MTLDHPIRQPLFSIAETSNPALGDLPGWKLSDLYPSAESAEYKGIWRRPRLWQNFRKQMEGQTRGCSQDIGK